MIITTKDNDSNKNITDWNLDKRTKSTVDLIYIIIKNFPKLKEQREMISAIIKSDLLNAHFKGAFDGEKEYPILKQIKHDTIRSKQ